MATVIDEPIKVGVVFEEAQARPAWFVWRSRRYVVREVTLCWRTQEGQATLLHLGATDGSNLFELVFNLRTLGWRLHQVETDGGA